MNPLSVSCLFHVKCFIVYWVVVYNQNGDSVPEHSRIFRSLKNIYRGEITANRTIPELKGSISRSALKISKILHRVTVEHVTLPFQRYLKIIGNTMNNISLDKTILQCISMYFVKLLKKSILRYLVANFKFILYSAECLSNPFN